MWSIEKIARRYRLNDEFEAKVVNQPRYF